MCNLCLPCDHQTSNEPRIAWRVSVRHDRVDRVAVGRRREDVLTTHGRRMEHIIVRNHVWAVGGPERQHPLSFWGQGGAHARVVRVQKLDRNVARKPRPKPTPNNHRATGLGAAHLLPSPRSVGVIFWCCWMTATGGLSRSSPPSKSSKPSKPSKPPKPPKLPKPLHPPCDRQTNSWHPRDPLEAPL